MRVNGPWVARQRLMRFSDGAEPLSLKRAFIRRHFISFNKRMKTPYLIVLCSSFWLLNPRGQAAPSTATAPGSTGVAQDTPWAVVEKDGSHSTWQRTICETAPDGKQVLRTHKYVELSAGLNYWDSNTKQWMESKEQIEAFPNGAIARQGQYQVIFASNLNTAGSIDMQTPDGKRLRSSILGLAYHDSATGNSVLIAQIQDSAGELIASNQVLYPDAFEGVSADVRYTYRKGRF